ALSTPAAVNRTFELAGPDRVTWEALNERILRVLGKRRLAVRVPIGLVRAGASAAELAPPLRGARSGVEMLELDDNVTNIAPAVETFRIQPISREEQLRPAVARVAGTRLLKPTGAPARPARKQHIAWIRRCAGCPPRWT